MLCGDNIPFAGQTVSRAPVPLNKKRELLPGPLPASPGSLALPPWAPPQGGPISVARFGNIDPIPFQVHGGELKPSLLPPFAYRVFPVL